MSCPQLDLYTALLLFMCLQKAKAGHVSPAAAQQKISGLQPVISHDVHNTPVDKVLGSFCLIGLDLGLAVESCTVMGTAVIPR